MGLPVSFDYEIIPEYYREELSIFAGSARPCPLPIDDDPDLFDYTNEGDVIIIEG